MAACSIKWGSVPLLGLQLLVGFPELSSWPLWEIWCWIRWAFDLTQQSSAGAILAWTERHLNDHRVLSCPRTPVTIFIRCGLQCKLTLWRNLVTLQTKIWLKKWGWGGSISITVATLLFIGTTITLFLGNCTALHFYPDTFSLLTHITHTVAFILLRHKSYAHPNEAQVAMDFFFFICKAFLLRILSAARQGENVTVDEWM